MSKESNTRSRTDDCCRTLKAVPSCLRNSSGNPSRRQPRSVSFPVEENALVTGYLEPANPWEYADNVTREELVETYTASCEKHGTCPLPQVLKLIEELDLQAARNDCLNLKGEILEQSRCESLEEILKRVQFRDINLEGTSLDDEGSVALFDMVEYYESATHLNISGNKDIGVRGWQACSRMIKKMQCLEQLDARNVTLNEQMMPILSRALRIGSHLQVLKLENCNLTGRPMVILAAALKLNTGLRELYLADNNLGSSDAVQLGAILRTNLTLQLLDVSNNCVQDAGLGHIADGLIEQKPPETGGGLGILVLWNNRLTRNSSTHFARAVSCSQTLEMLNMGQNVLTNECLHVLKDSLQQNRVLLRLGMQSTNLSCEGAVALAECIADNSVMQRIDLRDNSLRVAGLMALAHSMKVNSSVTQLDLDDTPRGKLESHDSLEQYRRLVAEIRAYCSRNEAMVREGEDKVSSECEGTPERRGRLASAASRKISLTCETLLRQSGLAPDPERHLLSAEPRRSGGRLRSPAPSPVPSPVSSPVPSPSRTRFQVCRVTEPVTPPSLSSSPTVFFPSPSPTSRFRVTLVEPPNSTKPAFTSPSGSNVTVGFAFEVHDTDAVSTSRADDAFSVSASGSSPREPSVSETGSQSSLNTPVSPARNISHPVKESGTLPRVVATSSTVAVNIRQDKKIEDILIEDDTSSQQSFDSLDDTADMEVREIMGVSSSSDDWTMRVQDSVLSLVSKKTAAHKQCSSSQHVSKNEKPSSPAVERKASASVPPRVNDTEVKPSTSQRVRKVSWIAPETPIEEQKPQSGLERLLGLFQHPSSFFNKTQPQYKATTAIVNQHPVSNSNASFLLTSGPLAFAAGSESLGSDAPKNSQLAGSTDTDSDRRCSSSEKKTFVKQCPSYVQVDSQIPKCDIPIPDIINNNQKLVNDEAKFVSSSKHMSEDRGKDTWGDVNFNMPSCQVDIKKIDSEQKRDVQDQVPGEDIPIKEDHTCPVNLLSDSTGSSTCGNQTEAACKAVNITTEKTISHLSSCISEDTSGANSCKTLSSSASGMAVISPPSDVSTKLASEDGADDPQVLPVPATTTVRLVGGSSGYPHLESASAFEEGDYPSDCQGHPSSIPNLAKPASVASSCTSGHALLLEASGEQQKSQSRQETAAEVTSTTDVGSSHKL